MTRLRGAGRSCCLCVGLESGLARKERLWRGVRQGERRWRRKERQGRRIEGETGSRGIRGLREAGGVSKAIVIGESLTYNDDEHYLCVNPAKVYSKNGKTYLPQHPEAEPNARADFSFPALRPGTIEMYGDFASRDPSRDALIRVDDFCDCPTVWVASRLGSDNIKNEYSNDKYHRNVETPGRIEVGDDTSSYQEANSKGTDEAPGPDPKPEPHTASVTSHIVIEHEFLMRIGALK